MHKRSEIRAALVAALEARSALAGRVVSTRVRTTDVRELPIVIVYALREESEHVDVSMQLQRTAKIAIEIKARAADGEDLGDVLDGLCEEAEAGVYADTTLGGLAVGIELVQTAINLDGSGDARDGAAVLGFHVLYTTPRPTA